MSGTGFTAGPPCDGRSCSELPIRECGSISTGLCVLRRMRSGLNGVNQSEGARPITSMSTASGAEHRQLAEAQIGRAASM